MRALARYSINALAGSVLVVVACREATGPDSERSRLDPVLAAAARKPGPAADITPPTTPLLSATDVGASYVSLAWSSTDDRTYSITYSITVNGAPDPNGATYRTSRIYNLLQPATTYTFTVRARDNAGNQSAAGELAVTTKPRTANDTQAPSAPTNVQAYDFGTGAEFQVTWTASTDNVDAQPEIRYEVYVNGELSDVTVGKTESINYGVNGTNTVSVIAVDAAGNKSAAGTTTISFTL
jgi:hypothetical protein